MHHLFIALQGVLLFSIAYWFVYVAETHLTSGLVAVVCSSLIFMNIFNGTLFIGSKIKMRVILGAFLGITGIALIFWPELISFKLSDKGYYGLILCIISTEIYSLGNIVAARNQKHRLPVIQTNAYSMGYGALLILILAVFFRKTFGFELSISYIGSLFYLAVLGSVVAFGCYITLIGKIGADRAAYGPLVVPVIALGLSTLFEGYHWSLFSVMGIVLIVGGNILVLNRRTVGG